MITTKKVSTCHIRHEEQNRKPGWPAKEPLRQGCSSPPLLLSFWSRMRTSSAMIRFDGVLGQAPEIEVALIQAAPEPIAP